MLSREVASLLKNICLHSCPHCLHLHRSGIVTVNSIPHHAVWPLSSYSDIIRSLDPPMRQSRTAGWCHTYPPSVKSTQLACQYHTSAVAWDSPYRNTGPLAMLDAKSATHAHPHLEPAWSSIKVESASLTLPHFESTFSSINAKSTMIAHPHQKSWVQHSDRHKSGVCFWMQHLWTSHTPHTLTPSWWHQASALTIAAWYVVLLTTLHPDSCSILVHFHLAGKGLT